MPGENETRYFVSYVMADQKANSNSLWHTFLALSIYDPKKSDKLEVVWTYGFDPVHTTTKNTFIKWLKKKAGANVDLWGNHGVYDHEKIRDVDTGSGLHARTYPLSKGHFEALQQECHKIKLEIEEGIVEARTALGKTMPLQDPPKMRHYRDEKFSSEYFEYHKALEEKTYKKSKLPELTLTFSPYDQTCKTFAIDRLKGKLPQKELDAIKGWHPGVSRASGPTELVSWHSEGPGRSYHSEKGRTYFSRDKKRDPSVRLFWSLPPLMILEGHQEDNQATKMLNIYSDAIKRAIRKLQALEIVLRNATIENETHKRYRDQLVQLIIQKREPFAKFPYRPANADHYLSRSMFHPPRDENEKSADAFLKAIDDVITKKVSFPEKLIPAQITEVISTNATASNNADEKDSKDVKLDNATNLTAQQIKELLTNLPDITKKEYALSMKEESYTKVEAENSRGRTSFCAIQ